MLLFVKVLGSFESGFIFAVGDQLPNDGFNRHGILSAMLVEIFSDKTVGQSLLFRGISEFIIGCGLANAGKSGAVPLDRAGRLVPLRR